MMQDYFVLAVHLLIPISLGMLIGYFVGLKYYAKKHNLELSLS